MKTIQITRRFTDRAWGGTETVVLETSRRLQELGHPTEIFTTTALDERRRSAMRGVSIERHPYIYPWWGLGEADRRRLDDRGGNLFSASLGRALARRRGVDLIHLHTGKRLGGIARTVAKLKGVPYIVSLHGGLIDVPKEELERWAAKPRGRTLEWGKALGWLVGSRRVLEDAAAVICVNLAERVMLQKRFPDQRVEWLPNGVDTKRFETGDGFAFRDRFGIPRGRRLLTIVGRVDAQKNQLFALDVLEHLVAGGGGGARGDGGADWHLALIGPTTDSAYAARLEQRLRSSSVLADRVTWIPGLAAGSQELVDAYHGSDFLLVPSVHEPFGIVALEGWAAQLPVIGSRVGGLACLIQHDRDGFLVDGYDAAEWARAISHLDDHPGYGLALASAGRHRAQSQFDWSRITRRLISLYEGVENANSASQR